MNIEPRDLDSLLPYARNARLHTPAQVAQIAASIKEYGFNAPVLISPEGEIIAGHGRVMAAQLLDLPEVPCIVLGHLGDRERRAYMIADNRLADLSRWDERELAQEVERLLASGEGLIGLFRPWEDVRGVVENTPAHADPLPARLVLIVQEEDAPTARAWLRGQLQECPVDGVRLG